jgi:hypothetical protein
MYFLYKNEYRARSRWFMLVIPATQEADIRKIKV